MQLRSHKYVQIPMQLNNDVLIVVFIWTTRVMREDCESAFTSVHYRTALESEPCALMAYDAVIWAALPLDVIWPCNIPK